MKKILSVCLYLFVILCPIFSETAVTVLLSDSTNNGIAGGNVDFALAAG